MTKNAGQLDAWLIATDKALKEHRTTNVPCGTCTACCRSGQFIHVTTEDARARAVINPALLFPAPDESDSLLIGFDEEGRCPLLFDNACSIYKARPQACRAYDCWVFAATGVKPHDQPLIADAVGQWSFEDEGSLHAALSRARRYLAANTKALGITQHPIQLALSVIKTHALFLEEDKPDIDQVRARLA